MWNITVLSQGFIISQYALKEWLCKKQEKLNYEFTNLLDFLV